MADRVVLRIGRSVANPPWWQLLHNTEEIADAGARTIDNPHVLLVGRLDPPRPWCRFGERLAEAVRRFRIAHSPPRGLVII